jgi:hypothetical protein
MRARKATTACSSRSLSTLHLLLPLLLRLPAAALLGTLPSLTSRAS